MRYIDHLFIFLLFTILSCEAENDLPGSPPIADAGPDLTAPICLGTILLDGSNSSDPDKDSLTYTWTLESRPDHSHGTQESHPHATLNNDEEPIASLTPDMEGDYIINLTISDGIYPPVTDQLILTVTPDTGSPPVADAGEDHTARVNEAVILDGSRSSAPEGSALTYQWSLTGKPVGSQASITEADQAQAEFTPDRTGNYFFQLKVTTTSDGCTKEAADKLTVTAE